MFPVGDFIRTRRPPIVNWLLLVANAGIFVYTLTLNSTPDQIISGFRTSESDRFLIEWGFVPACLGDYLGLPVNANPREMAGFCPTDGREPLQVFTSMFVHAGWAHILGNMLFLWVFGDNVEDRLGHARYLAFYLLSGVVAVGAQTYMALDTVLPAVGASGAIAGILGAYLVLHPKARIRVVIFPFFFFPFFLPAILLIGIWFATQLFFGLASTGDATAGAGVAWWAHIGGFVAGVILIVAFGRRRRPRETTADFPNL